MITTLSKQGGRRYPQMGSIGLPWAGRLLNVGGQFVPPPVPPVTATSTPGFPVGRIPSQIRGETDEEATRRRIREGSIPAPSLVSDDGRLAEYSRKSAKLTAAVARLRDQTAQAEKEARDIKERIAVATRANTRMRLEKDLMLKEQALTLARAQEAALLEELTVIDIAYVAVVAIGMMLQ